MLVPEILADTMADGKKWPLTWAQLKVRPPLEWGEQRRGLSTPVGKPD